MDDYDSQLCPMTADDYVDLSRWHYLYWPDTDRQALAIERFDAFAETRFKKMWEKWQLPEAPVL